MINRLPCSSNLERKIGGDHFLDGMIGFFGLCFTYFLSRALHSINLESNTRGRRALEGLIRFFVLHFTFFLNWMPQSSNHERNASDSHHEMNIFLLVFCSHTSTPSCLHSLGILVFSK